MKRLFAILLPVTMLLMVFGAPVLTGAAITETIEYKSITLTSGDAPVVGDSITLYGQDFKTGGVVTSIGIIPEGQAIDGSKEMFSKLKLFYSHTGNDGKSAPDPNATINSSGSFEINAKLTASYGTQITPGTYKVFLWWLPDPNVMKENIAISNETFTVYGAEVTSSATYKAPTATPTAAPTVVPTAVPTVAPTATPTQSLTALPTASTVLVNGTNTAFDAYNITGYNFFKLRDFAFVVNGTAKQFAVTWDGGKNAINLVTKASYAPVGGELAKGDGKVAAPLATTSKIYKDGVEIKLTAYNINGFNYFKLRDLAKAFDIGVTWDAASGTIGIDTSISYIEP